MEVLQLVEMLVHPKAVYSDTVSEIINCVQSKCESRHYDLSQKLRVQLHIINFRVLHLRCITSVLHLKCERLNMTPCKN